MDNKNIEDFVSWTKLKIRIHLNESKKDFYFKPREIWYASLGANIGFETDGKNDKFERPVLIIRVFSADVLWILPLTSRNKPGKYYYRFNFGDQSSSVILSQLRLISSKRLLRKIGMLSENDFENIKLLIKNLL